MGFGLEEMKDRRNRNRDYSLFSGIVTVHQKVNIGKKLLSLRRPVCSVSLWLTSGNLDFRRVPLLTCKSGSLCQNYISNVVYAEHILSFWESEIKQRLPM